MREGHRSMNRDGGGQREQKKITAADGAVSPDAFGCSARPRRDRTLTSVPSVDVELPLRGLRRGQLLKTPCVYYVCGNRVFCVLTGMSVHDSQ